MRRILFLLLVALAGAALLVWAGNLGIGPILITREGEQKIVLFLSRPISVRDEPGLSLRPPIPILTEVLTFDRRLLYLNTAPHNVPTRDQERIVVDNYVLWRITDVLRFYESFPSGRSQAEARINDVVSADLREVIGQHTLTEVLTDARVELMQRITQQADAALEDAGITIYDVRINRTELPSRTVENVFARMRAERDRLARKYRAEGEEEARRIRAHADREALVIVAEAKRDAEIVRGAGDAEAAGIYAQAYSADSEFYTFVRSLAAYRKTIGTGTTMVVPTDHEFFRALQAPPANGDAAPSVPGVP